jgi:hypothetical protein
MGGMAGGILASGWHGAGGIEVAYGLRRCVVDPKNPRFIRLGRRTPAGRSFLPISAPPIRCTVVDEVWHLLHVVP